MRCLKCNVDLAENLTVCPLCGAKAANEKSVLQDVSAAPYPDVLPQKAKPFKPTAAQILLGVTATLGLLACVLSSRGLLALLLPLLFLFDHIFFFVRALRERGALIHAGVSLLSGASLNTLIVLVALLFGLPWRTLLFALICGFVLFVLLFTFRTERMEKQMQALFHL